MISPNDARKLVDKLMILYAYYLYKSPVDIEIINKILLCTDLFDYFMLATLHNELIHDKLIEKSINFPDKLVISPTGRENLEILMDKILLENRKKIAKNVQLNKQNDLEANGIIANFSKLPDSNYNVHLQLWAQDEQLIEINLRAPNNSIAQKIVSTWNNHAVEVLDTLLNEFDKYEK